MSPGAIVTLLVETTGLDTPKRAQCLYCQDTFAHPHKKNKAKAKILNFIFGLLLKQENYPPCKSKPEGSFWFLEEGVSAMFGGFDWVGAA